MATTERLVNFPSKSSPVPADIIYSGDSAASFNEVQITITQLISAYPNLLAYATLGLGANTYAYTNNSSVLVAGSISALAVALLADASVSTMQNTLGYTATAAASKFAGWDANVNLSANSFISGYATTATAAATTTLTVASAFQQFFTGSTTQDVILPVVSTLVLGQAFYVVNNSSGAVTVKSSGGNSIQVMAAGTTLLSTCISLSGTGTASWYADYNLQSALSLPLSLANGGTNAALSANAGAIIYSSASAFALSAVGNSGQLFISAGTSAPDWTTSTYPSTNAANTLLYASSANTMAALSTVNSAVLTTSAGGVPTWATSSLPFAISLTAGVSGVLPIANGGTNSSSVISAPAATTWAGWDANKNLSANSFISGYATTVTAAATTTLTVGSAYTQYFTGSTTQTVLMPVVSTLALGQQFYLFNTSSGNVTVQSSGGNNIQVMAGGTSLYLTVISTSGTTAASWNPEYAFNGGSGSGTVNSGTQYNLAYYATTGTAVSGLTNGTTGQVLTATTGAAPSFQALPATTGFTSIVIQTFTSSGTYTPTANMKVCQIECVGGGGGSGGATSTGASTYAGSAGGGGGGYSRKIATAATIGASQTVTIGAAGAAGASGAANAGGAGEDTSVGSLCIGKGGGGGGGSTNQDGGAGGVAGTGDFTFPGGKGGTGGALSVISVTVNGGAGGSTFYGAGTAVGGFAGVLYGCGASGSTSFNQSPVAGFAGATGLVVITEYI